MMGQENGNRMEDILLAITPDGNVREFRLNQMGKRQLTVGRSHDNDIVLDSSMVSHSHGQLFLKGGRAATALISMCWGINGI